MNKSRLPLKSMRFQKLIQPKKVPIVAVISVWASLPLAAGKPCFTTNLLQEIKKTAALPRFSYLFRTKNHCAPPAPFPTGAGDD